MKRIIQMTLACAIIALSGCSLLQNNGTDYETLSKIVEVPSGLDRSYSEWDNKELTFTAMVIEEEYTMESSDETLNGLTFAGIVINRCFNTYIYMDIEDVDFAYSVGDIIEVRVLIDGYITTSNDDGTNQDYLNVKAKKVTLSENSSDAEVDASVSYLDPYSNLKFTFEDYEVATNGAGVEVVLVYAKVENENETNAVVDFTSLAVEQGDDIELYPTKDYPETFKHPDALKNLSDLASGETKMVVFAFESEDSSLPLFVRAYDDNFSLIYESGLDK